ncbi:low molecular weight protein-tyrosine-phosphatase [Rothia similmucilaginosa]
MTVCTGNICRSPVGEYLIRQHAQEAGVPVTVTSSGISNEEEGNRIDPRAAAQLTTRGIDPSAHRACVFTVGDFDRNDLILAMDAPHYLRLKTLARNDEDKAKIRMMRSFDPKVTTTHLDQLGIYDPWYGSERDFVYTTDLIDAAARGLINHLKQEGDAQ